MSLSTPLRSVSAPARRAHEHTRSCYWDHLACRWAGPSHPEPTADRTSRVPAPRPAPEG